MGLIVCKKAVSWRYHIQPEHKMTKHLDGGDVENHIKKESVLDCSAVLFNCLDESL